METPKLLYADAHVDRYYGTLEKPANTAQLQGVGRLGLALSSFYTAEAWNDEFAAAAAYRGFLQQQGSRIVRTQEDLERLALHQQGTVMHVEGLHWIPRYLVDSVMDCLLCLRPSIVQPFYNQDSHFGGGCAGEGRRLTDEGVALVRLLDAHGFIVDVAHAHPHTIDGVLRHTEMKPVIFSHGALSDQRFLSDAVFPSRYRALHGDHAAGIVERGGIIGLTPSGGMVRDRSAFVLQIASACKRFGASSIVIGSDLGGIGTTRLIDGYHNHESLFANLEHDLAQYLTPDEVTGVLGMNLYNFLRRWLPVLPRGEDVSRLN